MKMQFLTGILGNQSVTHAQRSKTAADPGFYPC